jgi:hypothetical protein
VCTAGATVLACGSGIDDATRHLPIGRGQYVPFFIASVASIVLWALPPIAYLVGYQIGKRWPMGYGLRDPIARHYREEADSRDPADP